MSLCSCFCLFHQVVDFSVGTSTPNFGQSGAPGPIPFGTPGQGFNSVPFGKPFRLCVLCLNMSVFTVNG